MRPLFILILGSTFATACTSSPPLGSPGFDSVRDRLSAAPTRLFIGPDGSSGSITAKRYTHDGWQEGTTPVVITNGELVARADGAGQLAVSAFGVAVDPIELPATVFGKPAQLRDLRVMLASQPVAKTTWLGDDDATATVSVDLDLSWSIAVDGNVAPLGTQHLPPISVELALTGAGDHVDAAISLHATGELWSWAGLLELTGIQFSLSGATVD
jgi:hypothetical protein